MIIDGRKPITDKRYGKVFMRKEGNTYHFLMGLSEYLGEPI